MRASGLDLGLAIGRNLGRSLGPERGAASGTASEPGTVNRAGSTLTRQTSSQSISTSAGRLTAAVDVVAVVVGGADRGAGRAGGLSCAGCFAVLGASFPADGARGSSAGRSLASRASCRRRATRLGELVIKSWAIPPTCRAISLPTVARLSVFAVLSACPMACVLLSRFSLCASLLVLSCWANLACKSLNRAWASDIAARVFVSEIPLDCVRVQSAYNVGKLHQIIHQRRPSLIFNIPTFDALLNRGLALLPGHRRRDNDRAALYDQARRRLVIDEAHLAIEL